MNRLAILQRIAIALPVPAHCEAYAKRGASDSLEVVIAYERDGAKYFCVAAFLDEWNDDRFRLNLHTIQALVPLMREAIRKGIPK